MINIKKLSKALKAIKKECVKHSECINCPFFDTGAEPCGIAKKPCNWRLQKQPTVSMIE